MMGVRDYLGTCTPRRFAGASEMVTKMGRAKKPAVPETAEADGADDQTITTLKSYKRITKKLAQVGALLNISQPEALARYESFIDDDLMDLLAKRQAELGKKKPGSS